MRRPTRRILRWSPGQWGLRLAAFLGVMVALWSTGLLGVWPAWWLVLLVAGAALGHAVAPEAAFGTVAMGLVIAWWGLGLRDGLHPQALVAAVGLLVSHLAGLVAAYGPDRLAVDRPTVLLWLRRGTVVYLFAPLAWVVATVVRDQPEPAGLWIAGTVAALVAVVPVAVVFRRGTVSQ